MSPLWSRRWTGNFDLKLTPLPLRILCGSAFPTQRESAPAAGGQAPPPHPCERLSRCKLFTLQSKHNQMVEFMALGITRNPEVGITGRKVGETRIIQYGRPLHQHRANTPIKTLYRQCYVCLFTSCFLYKLSHSVLLYADMG